MLASALPSLAQQNVYGCPVQPAGSIFYSRIDSLPVLAQSATYTAHMSTVSLSWDSSMGVSVSNSSAPTIDAQFAYTPSYNGKWRYPAYYAVDRQAGSLGGDYPADHHTIVVDSDTCKIWETYHAYVNPANGAIETGKTCYGKPCNAQSGWKYDATSFQLPTGGTTDAAGLPLLPLLWRAHEISDGAIQHPARFTLSRGYIQAGHPQWPASGTNGWGGVNNPPYGTRFRLKAGASINLSGLTAQQQVYAQTMITALRQYGLVLADIGISMNASVDTEAGQDPNIMAALGAVGSQINAAKLEAVDLSSLKPTVPTYQSANSGPSVQPVMVGTPYPTFLNIQAGTSVQLTSWVNGSTSGQDIDWEVTSGNIGTVTPQGLFTATNFGTGIAKGVLTVTALADPTATATVYIRVLPAGPIRIAAGQRTAQVIDHLGQAWVTNLFLRGGNSVYHSGDYPNWPVPSDPTQAAQMAVYQGASYTYGNDQVAHFLVPNGTYSVRLMFGQPYNGTATTNCSPFPTQWHNNIGIELQNAMVVSNYDFGASINHACAVPTDLHLSATVTNNELELALRNMVPDGSTSATSPQLNGVEIIRIN